MKRLTAGFVCLILLIVAFQSHAASPFIYGIHDHDTNPQEYLDHIRNGGATGWITATVAIGSNPNDYGGADFSKLSNQGHTVTFGQNFVEPPRLITSLTTFDGADSSQLRYNRTSLSAESVSLRVEEDTAHDTETDHTTERVGILAIEQSGLLTAKEY